MKLEPSLDILPSLLFPIDVNSEQDDTAATFIANIDTNSEEELVKLFDALIEPEFKCRIASEQQWYIDTLTFYLNKNEKFNRVFSDITTYLAEEPADKRQFMSVLLNCLKKYKEKN